MSDEAGENCRYLGSGHKPLYGIGSAGPATFIQVYFCTHPERHPKVTRLGLTYVGPDRLSAQPADCKSNIGGRPCGPDRRCYEPPEDASDE